MIPIMISRFTLALRKAAERDPNGDDDIFTTGLFVARAPTLQDDTFQRSTDLEAPRI